MLFGRDKTNLSEFDKMLPSIPSVLSEEMIRRDNFFHTAWTRLKFLRPDLCQEMADIECYVAGYVREQKPETDEEERPKGVVL